MDRIEFEVAGERYAVRRPTESEMEKSRKVYADADRKAVSQATIRRNDVDRTLREREEWDDEMQAQADGFDIAIEDAKEKLAGPEAPAVAEQLRFLRLARLGFLRVRHDLEKGTVESVSENEAFLFLTSVCLLHAETDKPVFRNLATYHEKGGTLVAYKGAKSLAELLGGAFNPEDVFLSK